MVVEAAGGGVARHVSDLADGLVASDTRVSVAYAPGRADASFLQWLEDNRQLAGVYPLTMRRAPGPWDLVSWWRLRSLIRRAGPFDLVHGHSTKAGALVRLAAAGLGVPTVYTPHAFITMNPNLPVGVRQLCRACELALSRMGDRIICVSEAERDHATGIGIEPGRMTVVHNGIPVLPAADREAARRFLGLAATDLCFGFVGRLSAQKAVERLIRAFLPVARTCPAARLAIVGEGPDLKSLERIARDLDVVSRVRFVGAANGPEVMAGFDAFVLASRYEGFPYVFLEAVARQLPIFTTNVGGAHAVVQEGVNGVVVEQQDWQKLTEVMLRFTSDQEFRARLCESAAAVAGKFTASLMVGATQEIYARLVADDAQG